jgi:hypothetical protein
MSDLSGRRYSTIERAYQLARSGCCATVDEIGRILITERYGSVHAYLAGPTIRRQLLALCKASATSGDAA